MAPKCCTDFQIYFSQVKIPVFIAVIIFAMSSWIAINGLWTELPLLVDALPESWTLPSYLVLIIQIANIGPILYTLANRLSPNKVKEWPVIYIIISIGMVACFLLIFFWDDTVFLRGKERSTPFFILTFFLAMVDTTSSVVFLLYMANFKSQYMTPFYIGEGFSGLVPAIVGLIQGTGSNPVCKDSTSVITNCTTGENTTEVSVYPDYPPPLFSVQVFLVFLLCMLAGSMIAFSCLHFTSYCKQEMITLEPIEGPRANGNVITEDPGFPHTDSTPIIPIKRKEVNFDELGMDKSSRDLSTAQYWSLLFGISIINGLSNGVLPATSSYTALPYGNEAYNLLNRLSSIASPLACFFALFVRCTSLVVVGCLTSIAVGLAGYQLYLADMSPYPPLQGDGWGEFFAVSVCPLSQPRHSPNKSIQKRSGQTSIKVYGEQENLLFSYQVQRRQIPIKVPLTHRTVVLQLI